MSFSCPVTKRTARVSSKSSKKMRLSSPQAPIAKSNVDIKYDLTLTPEAVQPDSGFCENLDSDVDSTADKSLPSYGNSNEDWILYADEDVSQDDGYLFQEEDALDIASVKANHGSYMDGKNNNNSLSSSLSFDDGRFHLNVIYESSRHPGPPTHVFTHHPTTRPAGVSTLQQWVCTHEQHEDLAYCFEQSPETVNCYHQLQSCRAWDEDIDLSTYDIHN